MIKLKLITLHHCSLYLKQSYDGFAEFFFSSTFWHDAEKSFYRTFKQWSWQKFGKCKNKQKIFKSLSNIQNRTKMKREYYDRWTNQQTDGPRVKGWTKWVIWKLSMLLKYLHFFRNRKKTTVLCTEKSKRKLLCRAVVFMSGPLNFWERARLARSKNH